ncbi:molecular chaperone DnaJ [Patescibacteria group bacterium]|nr:molecular chaperone DnaJ [Patescibacteria group bacterium]MBU4023238.1 molecular chaperone DnaJ [Patescibacteria group bacterium]MBU4078420.1 molecular chaperone DnaJ [Patescibacteria group bacterium]
MSDYYNILGVEKTATPDEIKKAYRKMAHKYHPDKGGDTKEFHKVNEAYQVLSSKEKREQYDKFGRVFEGAEQQQGQGFEGFDFGNFWQQAGAGAQAGPDFDPSDLGDIFEQFFGSKMRRNENEDIKRGDDIQIDVELNLEDVLTPVTHKIAIMKYTSCSRCSGVGAEPGTKVKECQTCRGTGRVQQIQRSVFGTITRYAVCPDCGGEGNTPEKPCNVCHGEGRLKNKEEIQIEIPAGVDSGQVLKFQSRGDAGRKGGSAGDLYVRLMVKPHRIFERKGDDLYTEAEINFSKAVLGGEVEIPSLEKNKKIILKIPKNTDSGKIFKMTGKGVPHFNGYNKGNLYVLTRTKTPKILTRTQKDLINKLRHEGL